MQITEVAQKIISAKSTYHPVLIAIEGFGGAGKSTIANKLAETLGNAFVISVDDFIVKEKLTEPSWDKGSFDHARLEQQVLIPIKNGQPASYQKLLWQANQLSEPVVVPNVNFLIIEGISTYHPDIKDYYDYKIWIDTPIDVANKRGHVRDRSNENTQHWKLWSQNDLRYQQKHHPELAADFVIENH